MQTYLKHFHYSVSRTLFYIICVYLLIILISRLFLLPFISVPLYCQQQDKISMCLYIILLYLPADWVSLDKHGNVRKLLKRSYVVATFRIDCWHNLYPRRNGDIDGD